MRVVDAEGQFVGFVREVKGQDLVVSRPSASDIRVPMAACDMFTDRIKLSLYGHELAQLGQQDHHAGELKRVGGLPYKYQPAGSQGDQR